MPFLVGKTYKTSFYHNGTKCTLSTGRQRETDAGHVEKELAKWLGKLGQQHARPDVVALLVSKALPLVEAYEAALGGTLDALVKKKLGVIEGAANEVDLWPHVKAWHEWKRTRAKKGRASAGDYLRQVKALFPPSEPFTLSMFTANECHDRIDRQKSGRKGSKRTIQDPTKRRYKAAVSSLGKYLVSVARIIERNPIRDLEAEWEENPAREVHYLIPDAQRLIAAMGQPDAGAAAVALGFAAEWCAIEALTVRDLEFYTEKTRHTPEADDFLAWCNVHGTKGGERDRRVPLVPCFEWLLPYLKAAVAGKLPGAKVFPGMAEHALIDSQRRTAKALGIVAVNEATATSPHSLHDWRHTHTVAIEREGYPDYIAQRHLGHTSTDMVRRVYGKGKKVHRDDYRRAEAAQVAAAAVLAKRQKKASRAG